MTPVVGRVIDVHHDNRRSRRIHFQWPNARHRTVLMYEDIFEQSHKFINGEFRIEVWRIIKPAAPCRRNQWCNCLFRRLSREFAGRAWWARLFGSTLSGKKPNNSEVCASSPCMGLITKCHAMDARRGRSRNCSGPREGTWSQEAETHDPQENIGPSLHRGRLGCKRKNAKVKGGSAAIRPATWWVLSRAKGRWTPPVSRR